MRLLVMISSSGGGYFTEWNGTERNVLNTERNWSYGTQFSELYCSEKGSRSLDYVHNVILECKTVNYSYYIKNITTNLQSILTLKKKKDSNAHMQASNA